MLSINHVMHHTRCQCLKVCREAACTICFLLNTFLLLFITLASTSHNDIVCHHVPVGFIYGFITKHSNSTLKKRTQPGAVALLGFFTRSINLLAVSPLGINTNVQLGASSCPLILSRRDLTISTILAGGGGTSSSISKPK